MLDLLKSDVDVVSRIETVPSILDIVCRMTGMRFAAVARVTEDRWLACSTLDLLEFGLEPGGELKIETTICREVRDCGETVIIEHVAQDPVYAKHHTPAMYGFQSYVSIPIRLPAGEFFGTLCALDRDPMPMNRTEIMGTLAKFAELIGFHIDAQYRIRDAGDRVAASEVALSDERRNAELREQFIAVLGHDLRNPIAAVLAGAHLLRKSALDERARGIVAGIEASATRMSRLTNDMMDFASGRLGGGLVVELDDGETLPLVLESVTAELRVAYPERIIVSEIAILESIRCDPARVGQLLSNLLGNALTHGDPAGPVTMRAITAQGVFELSVSNSGTAIPAEAIGTLFQPFVRAKGQADKQGLGLGLYIASEVARAHGGEVAVQSTSERTTFTLRMPVAGRLCEDAASS